MSHRRMVEAAWLAELDDALAFPPDRSSESSEASAGTPRHDWVDAQEFAAECEAELARLAPQIEAWAVPGRRCRTEVGSILCGLDTRPAVDFWPTIRRSAREGVEPRRGRSSSRPGRRAIRSR